LLLIIIIKNVFVINSWNKGIVSYNKAPAVL